MNLIGASYLFDDISSTETNKPQQGFVGTILKQKQILDSDPFLEVKSIPNDYIMRLGNPADHHSSDAIYLLPLILFYFSIIYRRR